MKIYTLLFCFSVTFPYHLVHLNFLFQDSTTFEAIPPPPAVPNPAPNSSSTQLPGPSVSPPTPDENIHPPIPDHSYVDQSMPEKVISPKYSKNQNRSEQQKPTGENLNYICHICDKSFSVQIILKYFSPHVNRKY